jgi:hypothetical protein
MQANASGPAAGRMDLLTTVLHELGNAMGFAEDQGHDVASDTLAPGVRDLPLGDFRFADAGTPGVLATTPVLGDTGALFYGLPLNAGGVLSAAWDAVSVGRPAVDWTGTFLDNANDHKPAQSSTGAHWLSDFVNHLGQNESQRNPNSAIRVQISSEIAPNLSNI